MSVVWPERFAPQGLGQHTKLDLPGVATRSALHIATIASGVTVTLSRFMETDGRSDDIRRQTDTVLVVLGLKGVTHLTCLSTGQTAQIRQGECWLIHPLQSGIRRHIAAQDETSSFVISIRQQDVSDTLKTAAAAFCLSGAVFAKVETQTTPPTAFATLFHEDLTPIELLQVEAQCLGFIADALVCASSASETRLTKRVRTYLEPRLAKKTTLEDVARHIGVNRTKLNATLRAEAGVSVFELLRDMRVSRARSLLQTTGKSLAEVADATGFSSASHLCRTLKSFRAPHAANDTETAASETQ